MSGIRWTSSAVYRDADGNVVAVVGSVSVDDGDFPDIDPAEDALDDDELPEQEPPDGY